MVVVKLLVMNVVVEVMKSAILVVVTGLKTVQLVTVTDK
jgi:hypothetical protein